MRAHKSFCQACHHIHVNFYIEREVSISNLCELYRYSVVILLPCATIPRSTYLFSVREIKKSYYHPKTILRRKDFKQKSGNCDQKWATVVVGLHFPTQCILKILVNSFFHSVEVYWSYIIVIFTFLGVGRESTRWTLRRGIDRESTRRHFYLTVNWELTLRYLGPPT